jgi:tripartite-type tricarboxylate transporter receptor subunit TctC
MNFRITTLITATLVAALATQAQAAAPYPAQPVRLIVPGAPGTAPDLISRILAERLTRALGQPVVVENRVGAIGTIGLHAVARAAPDGYTLGVLAMPYVVAPSLLPQVPYDTEKDLAPVTLVSWNYAVLTVPSTSPARSVADLVTLAKAQPGLLKFASPGNGTPPHLAGELLMREAGGTMTHIPYKGAAPAVTAVFTGEVDMYFGQPASLAPHLKSGKLRALATAAPQRLAAYPDLPTLVELGYPTVRLSDWIGIVAPAGTPAEVIRRLHAELTKILATPEVRQRLEASGMEAAGSGPEEFSALISSELRRWAKLVREIGIKAD